MDETRIDEANLFNEARRIEDPAERERFISRVCGAKTELRDRVLKLVADYHADPTYLSGTESVGFVTPGQHLALAMIGMRIGPYELKSVLGEGGMGVVFLAEQLEPIRRTVALKLVKPGMDSREILNRFSAERQALALMDHPYIARALDAGTAPNGHPYFVMEFVAGIPITEYCREKRLGTDDRLRLFRMACEAVMHAHQKGVIHRDLKPTNILVAEQDGQPVPKVIDFGVAKAISQPLTDQSVFTAAGQLLGTLEYMSPEQVRLDQRDVDTRTDVYAMGILLYELLTGLKPYEAGQLRSAAFDEIVRMIREVDPPRPSARLSGSQQLSATAASQNSTPSKLRQRLSTDLDWVVMKAIEKDRSRRYESMNALAADVSRVLNSEPISALPPSWAYKLKKFYRRRQTYVVSATLAALIASICLTAAIWQASIATEAAQAALVSDRLAELAKRNEQKAAESARAAEHSMQAAVQSREEAQYRSLTMRGLEFWESNDLPQALPWFHAAAAVLPDSHAKKEIAEIRLSAMLDQAPRIVLMTPGTPPRPNNTPYLDTTVSSRFDPAGRWFLSPDGVYDASNGTKRATFDDKRFLDASFPNGRPRAVLMNAGNKSIEVVDFQEADGELTSALLQTFSSQDSRSRASISPNGLAVAVLEPLNAPPGAQIFGVPHSLHVYDVRTAEQLLLERRETRPEILFSPDSRIVAIHGPSDKQTTAFDLGSSPPAPNPFGTIAPATRIALASNPDRIAVLSEKRDTITVIERGKETPVVIPSPLPQGFTSTLQLSADGRRVFAWCGTGPVSWWATDSGQQQRPFVCAQPVSRVDVSDDGNTVAVLYSGGSCRIWRVDSNLELGVQAYMARTRGITLSSNGQRLAVLDDASRAKVIDLSDSVGQPTGGIDDVIDELRDETRNYRVLVWSDEPIRRDSPDTYLEAKGISGTYYSPSGPRSEGLSTAPRLATSPVGRMASTNDDRWHLIYPTVRAAGDPYLWNASSKQVVKSDWLRNKTFFTRSAAMSSDGVMFMTVDGDRRIRVWETETAWPIWISPPSSDEYARCRFIDNDSTIQAWYNQLDKRYQYTKRLPIRLPSAEATDATIAQAEYLASPSGERKSLSNEAVYSAWRATLSP